MDIEQLRKIAIAHARRIRTKCEFHSLSDKYTILVDRYVFYAYYRCKKRMMVKKIVLSQSGKLIGIIN